MVWIRGRRDARGRVRELRCNGHARFDQEGGTDLVCAGVSALLGALTVGLERVVQAPVDLTHGDGRFRVVIPARLPEEKSRQVQTLLETVVAALQEMEGNYKGFLRFRWLAPQRRVGERGNGA